MGTLAIFLLGVREFRVEGLKSVVWRYRALKFEGSDSRGNYLGDGILGFGFKD
jgi:hypothetical protein